MPQRKPLVYLAVILLLLIGGGMLLPLLLVQAYARSRGIALGSVGNAAGATLGIAAVLLWIPLSLLLANALLFAIPPLRRIAEGYATAAKRPDFATSQRQLLKIALVIGLICVPAIAAVFVPGQ